MKKISMLLGTACAFAAILSSCSKMDVEEQVEPEVTGGEITLTINAGGLESKTFVDGTSIKWNSTGEYLRVFEDADGAIAQKRSAQGTTTNEGATMSFNVTLDKKSAAAFNYYAFYPNASYQEGATAVTNVGINTPYAQTPTATSFDPAADLLIAEPVDNGNVQATSLDMAFARVVAIGKMTVKNLGTTDPVKSITFSAKNGGAAIPLAGRTSFNISTAKPVSEYGDRTATNMIVLDYSALSLTANESTGMDAWFTCFPFDLGSGDSFKVVVETETQTFTKEVNLTTQKLSFKAGLASRFSVNMDGIAGEAKAVDLRYAFLTYEDYAPVGSGSYASATVNKPHGDKWQTFAMKSGGGIQLRNSGTAGDASFIKIPELAENLKTVTVTLTAAIEAGNTLSLENTSSGTGGSILSLTTVAEQTVYTFDLTSKSVKTAYLRTTGAAAKVSKIEVYAGEDNRAAKAISTSSVSAELNDDNDAVTNTIDVSWDAVDGAAGYQVTLTPAEGAPVIKTVGGNVTSVSFTDLLYTTSYTPSVVTIADSYLYKANSDSVEASPVSTGAAIYVFTTVAGLNALLTSTPGSYTGTLTDAVVSFVPATNTAIIKDATGSIMYYKSGHGLKQNQTYTGMLTVTAVLYNSLYSEITEMDASFTGDESTVAPESISLSALIGNYATYQNAYVQVSGLTVTAVSGKNITVTDGVNSYVVFDNPGTATCIVGDVITAKGTITKYSSTEEIKIWSASDLTITSYAPRAITFSQPGGAAGTAGCSFTVTKTDVGDSITSGDAVASGTSITLTATAGTNYEFTSWTVTGATVADASAASTTFTMGTSPVTIAANFTSTGGGSFTPFNVWEDGFSNCTNGNALTSLSGSTTGFTGDYSGISTTYPMDGAIRIGKASGGGAITTPALSSISGTSASLTISFKAAGWNNKTAKLTLSVNKGAVTEGQTTIDSEATMAGNTPSMTGKTYTFHVTGADNTTAITFTTTNSIGIDDLVITQTAN